MDFFEATRRESSDGMRRRGRDASKRKKVANLDLFYARIDGSLVEPIGEICRRMLHAGHVPRIVILLQRWVNGRAIIELTLLRG